MRPQISLGCLTALLVISACDFGFTRNVMNSGQVANVTALGTNSDFDLLFVGDATGRMLQADPVTGVESGATFLWNGANSLPLAITADPDNSERVWALHADGFVVNWTPGPAIGPWLWPPGFVGTERTYCDYDRANDGDSYMTTVDDGVAMLWRRPAAQGWWWSGTVIGTEDCPRISHDSYFDRLYVLRGNGFTLERREADATATVLASHNLDVDGGMLADIDIFAGTMVGAGETSAPSGLPPGGGFPVPSFRMAWNYNPETGDVLDAKIITGGPPSAVNITLNATTSVAEMLVGSSAGTNSVRAVPMLDD